MWTLIFLFFFSHDESVLLLLIVEEFRRDVVRAQLSLTLLEPQSRFGDKLLRI